MKKLIILAASLLSLAACSSEEAKVMARFVPERHDDFIFENNYIAGRFYGEDLEHCGPGEMISPGIDIWVKKAGPLVCNQRYIDELQNGKSYHKDWGNGKDCYAVGRTMGGGASAVLVDGKPAFPATNYRSWEVLDSSATQIVFVLTYPEWEFEGEKIALSKKVILSADTYFVKVEDTYTFSGALGDSLDVVAGINRHVAKNTIEQEYRTEDRYAIWEHASDTGTEPEDGMIGVGIIVPGATISACTADEGTGIVGRKVASGEVFTYYFGSCWSKAELKTSEDWFNKVKEL